MVSTNYPEKSSSYITVMFPFITANHGALSTEINSVQVAVLVGRVWERGDAQEGMDTCCRDTELWAVRILCREGERCQVLWFYVRWINVL